MNLQAISSGSGYLMKHNLCSVAYSFAYSNLNDCFDQFLLSHIAGHFIMLQQANPRCYSIVVLIETDGMFMCYLKTKRARDAPDDDRTGIHIPYQYCEYHTGKYAPTVICKTYIHEVCLIFEHTYSLKIEI